MYIAEGDTPCKRYDPELWFSKHGSRKTKEAKRLCSSCVERLECLASTVQYEKKNGIQSGTFGGLSYTERATLLRRKVPTVVR